MFSKQSKYRLVPGSTLGRLFTFVMPVFVILIVLYVYALLSQSNVLSDDMAFASVEVGVAELSPNGEMGGYAIPASGGSAATCAVSVSEDPIVGTATLTITHNGDRITQVEEVGAASSFLANVTSQTVPVGAPDAADQITYNITIEDDWYEGSHTGSGGKSSSHSGTDQKFCSVTVDVNLGPIITFEQRTRPDGGAWSGYATGDLTGGSAVDLGTDVELRWTVTNADSCTALGGNGFVASGMTGSDMVIVPAPGASDTFTIQCNNSVTGLSSTASIQVETKTFDIAAFESDWRTPAPLTWQGAWSTGNRTIFIGEQARLRWSTTMSGGVDSCALRADTDGDGVFTNSEATAIGFNAISNTAGVGMDATVLEPPRSVTYGFEVQCTGVHSNGTSYTTPPARLNITTADRIDLTPNGIIFNPAAALPGAIVDFSTDILNVGVFQSAAYDVDFEFYTPAVVGNCAAGGTLVDSHSISQPGPLAAGGSSGLLTAQLTMPPASADYCVSVEVKTSPTYPDNDTNPSNNKIVVPVAVLVAPVSLTIDPSRIVSGDKSVLTIDINGNSPSDCTITGPGVGAGSLDTDGDPFTPETIGLNNVTSSRVYDLTCSGVGPSQSDRAELRAYVVGEET